MSLVIAAKRVVDADGERVDAWVRIEGDTIAEIGTGALPGDAVRAGTLMPAFVDLHCHGGGGASFTSADPDEIGRAASTHLAHGTTTMHASLVSAAYDDLSTQVRALIPFVDDGTLRGIHLEGPWISRAYCGAHDPAALRAPDPGEVARILDAGDGRIRMVTLAPELPGALESIRIIVERGAVAAIGHTAADRDAVRAAVDAGATVATHLFNAMPPLLHRDAGPVGVLLADPRVTCEVIGDGVHLEPEVVALALSASEGRGALVTDAMSAAGAGDGSYRIGRLDVVVRDGVARLREGGGLAGSTLLMDSALRRTIRLADRTLAQASRAASLAPARAMGLGDRGLLAVGQRADVVLLDDDLRVARVMRGGAWA
ncbi:MAG: N-acetylglucosamine-6-phosphate deacetylase [Actinomycetota bacterium]|jgi:N-acetylglucosamine-6-phosphate deacetylase